VFNICTIVPFPRLDKYPQVANTFQGNAALEMTH